MGQGWRVGEIRAAVFALVGGFAEIATYVRQRRVTTENRDETLLFEIVTGILDDGDNVLPARAHGPDACRRLRRRSSVGAQGPFPNTAQARGWTLCRCCVRSEAWHRINVEDGQRIEIARMQQLLAERD